MACFSRDGAAAWRALSPGINLETGNVWQRTEDISWDNTILAGSLFLGFDTPIGPLYIGYGRTDTDREGAYVYLGPRFTF